MKQRTNKSIYSYRATKRTETRKKMMKHSETLIDDDGSHAMMVPVTVVKYEIHVVNYLLW